MALTGWPFTITLALATVLAACSDAPGGDDGADSDALGLDALSGNHGAGADFGPRPPGSEAPGRGDVPACLASGEICDAVDNDCNAAVDEVGCACTPETACFAGPPSARGVGECRDGSRTCDGAGEFAGPCTGSVVPTLELCDGLDNDCDGEADEGCCENQDCPDANIPPVMPTAPPTAPPTGPPTSPPGCERGGVAGLVCAPDGSPVAGAAVTVETTGCDGQPLQVAGVSDANGGFSLDGLAPGPHQVIVQAGRFRQVFNVEVVAGQVTRVETGAGSECIPPDALEIAVVSGDYDSIEGVLQGLGFEHDVYCGDPEGNYGARALFGQWDLLSQYDVVFINCGMTVDFNTPEGATMVANLQRFVNEGNALYISDLAANVIIAAWPDRVRFDAEFEPGFMDNVCCTCVQCPAQCVAQANVRRNGGACQGTTADDDFCETFSALSGFGPGGDLQATVPSPALAQALGRNALTIHYGDGGWSQISGVAVGVSVLVEARGEPLMVQFEQPGGGRVAYTTFHNEAQLAADVATILRALIFQL